MLLPSSPPPNSSISITTSNFPPSSHHLHTPHHLNFYSLFSPTVTTVSHPPDLIFPSHSPSTTDPSPSSSTNHPRFHHHSTTPLLPLLHPLSNHQQSSLSSSYRSPLSLPLNAAKQSSDAAATVTRRCYFLSRYWCRICTHRRRRPCLPPPQSVAAVVHALSGWELPEFCRKSPGKKMKIVSTKDPGAELCNSGSRPLAVFCVLVIEMWLLLLGILVKVIVRLVKDGATATARCLGVMPGPVEASEAFWLLDTNRVLAAAVLSIRKSRKVFYKKGG